LLGGVVAAPRVLLAICVDAPARARPVAWVGVVLRPALLEASGSLALLGGVSVLFGGAPVIPWALSGAVVAIARALFGADAPRAGAVAMVSCVSIVSRAGVAADSLAMWAARVPMALWAALFGAVSLLLCLPAVTVAADALLREGLAGLAVAFGLSFSRWLALADAACLTLECRRVLPVFPWSAVVAGPWRVVWSDSPCGSCFFLPGSPLVGFGLRWPS
jgi:hypothetical protein